MAMTAGRSSPRHTEYLPHRILYSSRACSGLVGDAIGIR